MSSTLSPPELTAERAQAHPRPAGQPLDRACPHRTASCVEQLPAGDAVAEIGWSKPAKRDFAGFIDRLVPQMNRMEALGLTPAASAFTVRTATDYTPGANAARVGLSSEAGLPIRYTIDGSPPTTASHPYRSPLTLAFPTRLRAATFYGERPLGAAIDKIIDARTVRTRSDEQLKTAPTRSSSRSRMTIPPPGPRAVFVTDIFNPCWIFEKAPVGGARRVAIDVGQIPFNFQISKAERDGIRFRAPATPAGEFEVRAGGCDGERVAVLPLGAGRAIPVSRDCSRRSRRATAARISASPIPRTA